MAHRLPIDQIPTHLDDPSLRLPPKLPLSLVDRADDATKVSWPSRADDNLDRLLRDDGESFDDGQD